MQLATCIPSSVSFKLSAYSFSEHFLWTLRVSAVVTIFLQSCEKIPNFTHDDFGV